MKNIITSSYLLLCTSFLLISCGTKKNTSTADDQISSGTSDHTIQAVMWMQNAAEYKALSYQAFNIAKLRLDEYLGKRAPNSDKKPAIITDIDETVLDNSPSSAKDIEDGAEYSSERWADWVAQEEAEEVPGAADFLNYAKSRDVEIFYVTNRITDAEEATLNNMRDVDFPDADAEHLLLRSETSSKKARFEKIEADYDVLLYLGDNLSDFTSKFRSSTERRNSLADSLQNHFGDKFIVLPNPIYGDWETKGIYEDRYDWSQTQKDSIRRANLKAY